MWRTLFLLMPVSIGVFFEVLMGLFITVGFAFVLGMVIVVGTMILTHDFVVWFTSSSYRAFLQRLHHAFERVENH